jgi:hypothetical protein
LIVLGKIPLSLVVFIVKRWISWGVGIWIRVGGHREDVVCVDDGGCGLVVLGCSGAAPDP